MKLRISKTLLATTLFGAGLLIAAPAPAFKGMGSAPATDGTETLNSAMMGHQGNTDLIVATINDRTITMGELMQSIMALMNQGGYGGREMSAELSRKLRYDALQELALEELAFQRGTALGISADPTIVDKQLEARINAAGGRETLEKSLAEQGKTIADVTKEISRYLVIKGAIRKDVYDAITISDDEVDTIYRENKDQFSAPEQVVVTDIIFFLDPKDPAATVRVKELAKKIREEHNNNPTLLTPDGFIVEKGVSVSPTNRPGLYEAAKKMQPGTLSDPLVVDGTLHLITFDHYQPAMEMPETQAKSAIIDQLTKSKRREKMAEWRENLLKEAKITIVHEMLQDEKKNGEPKP